MSYNTHKEDKMTVTILYREDLKEYDFGPGHPFRGDRYQIFPKFLVEHVKPDNKYRFLKAEPATDEDLRLICDPDYIEFTKKYFQAAYMGEIEDEGAFFQYHTMDNLPRGRPGKLEEAARMVIGQAKLAADLVQSGKEQKVISLGGGLHHAKRNFGEGFCIYNDVAFTGTYLIEKYNLKRVLILDTDAHAGNGTAEYFYSDPRVLFIDIHQDPYTLYPGTGFVHEIGEGEGIGKTVNIPLPPNAGNDSYKIVFEEIIEPLTTEFQPQIIVRNGGSDPHFGDELTSLGLTVAGFRMIGERTRKMAEVCDGKEIDLIASGYNREILPYAWLALVAGLLDWDVVVNEPMRVPRVLLSDSHLAATWQIIDGIKKQLKPYWKCF
jgi:acetoin utilization protein AcuC